MKIPSGVFSYFFLKSGKLLHFILKNVIGALIFIETIHKLLDILIGGQESNKCNEKLFYPLLLSFSLSVSHFTINRLNINTFPC